MVSIDDLDGLDPRYLSSSLGRERSTEEQNIRFDLELAPRPRPTDDHDLSLST